MVTHALYNGYCTGVADGKAFAYATVDIYFTAGCAIQKGVSGNCVLLSLEVAAHRGQHGDASATQSFAQIVIGLTFQLEVDTRYEECSETLSGRTFELDVQCMFGQAFGAVLGGDSAGEHRTAGAVGVGNGIFKGNFLLFVYGIGGGIQHFHVFYVVDAVLLVYDVADGSSVVHTCQYFVEADELMLLDAVIRFAEDEVGTPDDVVQLFHSNLCQILAYFAGKEGEVVHKVFAAPDETFAQFRVLGGYTYGTSVLVAFAHHHASQYDEGSGGETVFFRTEHGHEHYVASGFQLSVHLQQHLPAQPVQYQCLLRLAQSEFGRDAGISDGTCG